MSEIISNVESVTTAAKIVSAQKVETSQLSVDGKDLQTLIKERAPSYKELVTRMELPEDEIWSLHTDNGDIVYWHNADKMNTNLAGNTFRYSSLRKLPPGIKYEKMTAGGWLFANCGNLVKVNESFESLINGAALFYSCSSLTSFLSKLKPEGAEYSPLTSGSKMFEGCKLDAPSVENILTSLQPFTDGSEHIMTMQIQSAAVNKFNEITGNTLTLDSTYQDVPFRGWTVQIAII